MLTVEAALRLVLDHCQLLPAREVPASEALGLVLAEDIKSDVDSPPHDRAIVDGYAVQAADLASGTANLEVLEEVTAGAVPTRTVGPGQATRVMTGAPIPAGADAMVMIELTRLDSTGTSVEIAAEKTSVGQNIMRRAASMRRGQTILTVGTPIRAIECGLLAEVGRTHVRAIPRPSIAILTTGNELVSADQTPREGQIRNSNGALLFASAERAGGVPHDLGIGRDDRDELRRLIALGLEHDVLVISGGVSAGVLDLVPGVLTELEVNQVFHKVKLKPGKPLWFGALERDARQTLVFGLPGNPVSSLDCRRTSLD
jgi:molybdopterin molybdotransferase